MLRNLFLIFLALVLLLISFAFAGSFAFPDAAFPLQKGERVSLLPGEALEQTFTSNRDGLRKIEILFGNFDLTGDGELTIEIRDDSCDAVLAQKTLSQQSFESEYTSSFLFDRIPHSQGNTYCFRASFQTNQPIKKDKGPRFFLDRESTASPYQRTHQGGEKEVGEGPIAIRPGYTNDSFWKNAQELFDRISQYKPVFLKSWYLITFVTLGIGLTIATFLLLIRKEEEE